MWWHAGSGRLEEPDAHQFPDDSFGTCNDTTPSPLAHRNGPGERGWGNSAAIRHVIPRRSERTAMMVPGMTERERQNTDLQRLAWRCDAVIGPAPSRGRRPLRIGNPAAAPW